MTIEKLKAKLANGRCIIVHVYAPAEGYENRYYKLGMCEHNFVTEKVLGYEFIADEFKNDLRVIIDRPVDYTDVTITAHFVDGDKYDVSSPVHLQMELVELYDYWPAHMDYRSGKEWSEGQSD